MHVSVKYHPVDEATLKLHKLKIVGHAKYKMAEELKEEFEGQEYPEEFEFTMEKQVPPEFIDTPEKALNYFDYYMKLPFGELNIELKKVIGKKEKESSHPVGENEEGFEITFDPPPFIAKKQEELDNEEERQILLKQAEDKKKRKEEEDRKAKLAFERQ